MKTDAGSVHARHFHVRQFLSNERSGHLSSKGVRRDRRSESAEICQRKRESTYACGTGGRGFMERDRKREAWQRFSNSVRRWSRTEQSQGRGLYILTARLFCLRASRNAGCGADRVDNRFTIAAAGRRLRSSPQGETLVRSHQVTNCSLGLSTKIGSPIYSGGHVPFLYAYKIGNLVRGCLRTA